MALSEKHRVTLYQSLVGLIPDEEAVAEMMSYFPARDVEEPVSKEHLRAEMADLRTELHVEMAALRSDLRDELALLRSDLQGEMAGLRSEVGDQIVDVRLEIERTARRMQAWMIGTSVSVGAVVVGAAALFG